MSVEIILGDARERLVEIEAGSIDLTFTSPPYYNAREYSQYKSYEAYLEEMMRIFGEVHRVIKEGRFFVLNTSPTIVPRKSRAHQSKRYGIPFDLHHLLESRGWDFIDDIVWLKPDGAAKNRNGNFYQNRLPLGYKPNIVTEYLMVYRKKTDRLIDWNLRLCDKATLDASRVTGSYERTNAWHICPKADKAHPAVFPLEIASKIIAYYSMRGDKVLDPFMGSGTTGEAALKLGRQFIGIEKEPKYYERARQRIKGDSL